MTTELEIRLEQLAKRTRNAAHRTALQWYVDKEDVEQDMLLAICERAASDPSFLRQTDAYVVQHAVWRAVENLRREVRQRPPDTEDIDEIDEDGLWMQASSVWEQVELALAIKSAAGVVGERQEKVVNALLTGETLPRAAEIVGVPYRTVKSWIDKPLADALSFLVE